MAELKRTVLITVELADRELLSKCLLAYFLLKEGFRVYIGTVRAFQEFEGRLTSCVYLHKSTLNKKAKRIINKLGAVFCFLDEEAGPAIPRSKISTFIKNRYREVDHEKYQHIFAIGPKWKEMMELSPMFNGVKVHSTGWPRIDLWRPEFLHIYAEKVEEIRRENGDFILFLSSFGATDSTGFDELEAHDKELFGLSFNGQARRAFYDYLRLLKALAKKLPADKKLVIRPHPSESVAEWENLFREEKNVFVCRKGDVTPWILASSKVLQFRSTTGIQTALFSKVPYSYRHVEILGVTDSPVFEVNKNYDCPDELLKCLLSDDKDECFGRDIYIEDISSLNGELSSQKIAETLLDIPVSAVPPIRFSNIGKSVYKSKLICISFYQKLKGKLGLLGNIRPDAEKRPEGIKSLAVRLCLEELSQNFQSELLVEQILEDVVEFDYSAFHIQ